MKRTVLNSGYLYQNRLVIFFLRIIDCIVEILPKRNIPMPLNIKTMLLIKPDKLGDMLMLTSILPLIKQKFSECSIDMICGEWALPILEDNPYIYRKYTVNHILHNNLKKNRINKLFNFILTYVRTLTLIRKIRYDICLVMRAYGGNLISLAKFGKCKYIIGHRTGGLGGLLNRVVEWNMKCHEVEHFLEVLYPLGIEADIDNLKYELYPSLSEEKRVNEVIKKYELQRFAIIHPNSSDKRKCLNCDFCIKLIDKIDHSLNGLKIVFTGVSEDLDVYKKITKNNKKREFINLMGLFNIRELYIFFQKAEAIYTVDSLSAHIAAMTNARTVIFYGGINDNTHCRPLGKNIEAVNSKINCSPCFVGCRDLTCMEFSNYI